MTDKQAEGFTRAEAREYLSANDWREHAGIRDGMTDVQLFAVRACEAALRLMDERDYFAVAERAAIELLDAERAARREAVDWLRRVCSEFHGLDRIPRVAAQHIANDDEGMERAVLETRPYHYRALGIAVEKARAIVAAYDKEQADERT